MTTLIIPLKCWFNEPKQFDDADYLKRHPEVTQCLSMVDKLDSINDVQVLVKLLTDLEEMSAEYYRERDNFYGTIVFTQRESCFENEITKINDRINVLNNYDLVIEVEKYTINGYETYSGKNEMKYSDFLECKNEWYRKESMTYDEFAEEFERTACTDWNKIDEFGESFGGYWKYPEGTYERENAYDLTRKRNCQKLFELPYSKSFLIYTTILGCGNRMESVRYSNHLCEIMKKKLQLNTA